MASGPYGAVVRQIHQLFERGAVGGLPEWQLLRRYVTQGDEAAFEALVARHGPMVLGVCRRVLDDPHAVEDAFQATFLVLVRKAGALGERDAIGHWLYGVACRVSLRARAAAARRRAVEKHGLSVVAESHDDPDRHELAPVLDEELNKLPAKYRAPVVLCYLEGRTHEEAARQLAWPVGTVKGRLARAKDLLRGRLARRGLAPSAALVAAALGRDAAAAVPESLLSHTVQAALRIAAGRAAAGLVSTSALTLMEGVISTMFLTKLKLAAAVLGACGFIALGAGVLGQQTGAGRRAAAEIRGEPAKSRDASPARAPGDGPERNDQALLDKLDRTISWDLRQVPLEGLLKRVREESTGPNDHGLPIYVDPDGLREVGATINSPVTVEVKDAPLKTALNRALRPLKLGATTQNGLLVITSRQEVALIELQKLNDEVRRLAVRSPGSAARGPRGMSLADWVRHPPGRPTTLHADDIDEDSSPEDEAKTRAILDTLQKRIPMSFANDTPLEDVLKYLKEETKGNGLPDGIPIYVDPIGLQEAEKTIDSPVRLELHGIALRVTLNLLLKQLGMTYFVRNGLLTISAELSEQETEEREPMRVLMDKMNRGDLGLDEMKDLTEYLKARRELMPGMAPFRGMAVARMGPPAAAPAAPNPFPPAAGGAQDKSPAQWLESLGRDQKTKAVLDALEQTVPMSFAQETPLEDVLKYIKDQTKGEALPAGLPIYVDPVGLQEAEKTLVSVVTLELKGVPLKTTLRLVLKQLGLTYSVKNGMLTITSEASSDDTTPILELSEKAARGEMSLAEMKELVELFKTRAQVMRYAEGEGLATERLASKPKAAASAAPPAQDDDDAVTNAILAALNKAGDWHFDQTPLEDAIKKIQAATVGPALPAGIPIYLDPPNRVGPDAHNPKKITFNLKGVKLKTALRLMLHEIGLAYNVKEGLLIIADPSSPEVQFGGMGGMGGMGGGFR